MVSLFAINELIAQKSSFVIDIFLPEYGYLSINKDIKLFDTIRVEHSEEIFFRFVFFSTRGESYCEVYRNKKLYEKGFYANSLDTLKKYMSYRLRPRQKYSRIYISKYFQPLKNGKWLESKDGKYYSKEYDMGVNVASPK